MTKKIMIRSKKQRNGVSISFNIVIVQNACQIFLSFLSLLCADVMALNFSVHEFIENWYFAVSVHFQTRFMCYCGPVYKNF